MKPGRPSKPVVKEEERIVPMSIGMPKQLREKIVEYTNKMNISASSYVSEILKKQPELQ